MSEPGNLWTRSHGGTQRSARMRQPPGDPVKTSANIERFAEALDLLTHGATDARLVSGETEPRHDEQDLAGLAGLAALAELIDTATRIHLTDGVEPGDGNAHAPVHLEMERKQSIWEEVMRSQQEAKTSTGDSRSITSVVNGRSFPVECVGTGPATAHLPTARQRPLPDAWFRTRIDIQPVVTTLLVAALIVAIVAGYRGFGGGSGSLVTPTASAHGNPELAAIGSPEASPASAFACDVSGTPVARDVTSQSESYGYEKRGPISDPQAAAIPDLMARFAACMKGPVPDYLGLESIGTERFVTDLRQAVGGTPTDMTAIRPRSTVLTTAWEGPLPASEDPERVIWMTSNGTPEVLNMFLGTAQRLEDGRIGFLAIIAPKDVAPIPDQVWRERNDTAMLSVWFIGLEQTDAGLRVDEMFGMCGGGMCVSSFGADAATPEASREASREASPVASPVVSDSRRLPDATPSPAASGASRI